MARIVLKRLLDTRYMKNPVINALSGLTHPCQVLADLLTMWEKKGDFRGLKLAYVGDIFNVCHSLMTAGVIMGFDVFIAIPEGYGLISLGLFLSST